MRNLLQRLLDNILDGISAFFNLGVRLKYVVALLILFTGGAVALTYNRMLNNVGGRSDYEEAMRYIAMKDLIEEHFIDPVDRDQMTDSASASIVAGLGDKWSYYMTPDEYKSYQLYSSNDYSDIGMSMIKYSEGGFQIVSVTPGTPSANAGLTPGMIITAVDDVSVLDADIDDVRVLIRSRLNTKFNITVVLWSTVLELIPALFPRVWKRQWPAISKSRILKPEAARMLSMLLRVFSARRQWHSASMSEGTPAAFPEKLLFCSTICCPAENCSPRWIKKDTGRLPDPMPCHFSSRWLF